MPDFFTASTDAGDARNSTSALAAVAQFRATIDKDLKKWGGSGR
jgi:hypothetical protein